MPDGTPLKNTLRETGVTQVFLARKLGINYTLLSHYVRGVRAIPRDRARAIAKILRVRLVDILGEG